MASVKVTATTRKLACRFKANYSRETPLASAITYMRSPMLQLERNVRTPAATHGH